VWYVRKALGGGHYQNRDLVQGEAKHGSCYGNTLPYILTMHKVLSPLFLRYRVRNQLRLFLDSLASPRAGP